MSKPPWNAMVMKPLARPAACSGIDSIARTRAADAIMAAPTPWTRRETTRSVAFGARPHRSELTAITANPSP